MPNSEQPESWLITFSGADQATTALKQDLTKFISENRQIEWAGDAGSEVAPGLFEVTMTADQAAELRRAFGSKINVERNAPLKSPKFIPPSPFQ